jgi:hypothetical protein
MNKYRQAPTIWGLKDLIEQYDRCLCHSDQDPFGWVPARPLGLDTIPNRVRAAWLVFTGKADVIVWPGGQ